MNVNKPNFCPKMMRYTCPCNALSMLFIKNPFTSLTTSLQNWAYHWNICGAELYHIIHSLDMGLSLCPSLCPQHSHDVGASLYPSLRGNRIQSILQNNAFSFKSQHQHQLVLISSLIFQQLGAVFLTSAVPSLIMAYLMLDTIEIDELQAALSFYNLFYIQGFIDHLFYYEYRIFKKKKMYETHGLGMVWRGDGMGERWVQVMVMAMAMGHWDINITYISQTSNVLAFVQTLTIPSNITYRVDILLGALLPFDRGSGWLSLCKTPDTLGANSKSRHIVCPSNAIVFSYRHIHYTWSDSIESPTCWAHGCIW